MAIQKIECQTLTGPAEEYLVKPYDVFVIDPWVNHTFYIMEDAQWLNMLSQLIDPANPDIHRPF